MPQCRPSRHGNTTAPLPNIPSRSPLCSLGVSPSPCRINATAGSVHRRCPATISSLLRVGRSLQPLCFVHPVAMAPTGPPPLILTADVARLNAHTHGKCLKEQRRLREGFAVAHTDRACAYVTEIERKKKRAQGRTLADSKLLFEFPKRNDVIDCTREKNIRKRTIARSEKKRSIL